MIHVGNCISLWICGFEDTIFIGILRPLAIAFSVMIALFMIGDGISIKFDTNIIDSFEIFWIISPVIFFITIGVTSGALTYELLANDWHDVVIVLAAAQWYWNESINNNEHTNSTLIDEWALAISDSDVWRIAGTSQDVLHSYSLQDYGFHTDCIPGKLIIHVVSVAVAGYSMVTCQELCGYRHSGMTLMFSLE
jgi:heme/copper-type cytochrome/quinol oxidase subunit 2